MDEVTTESRFTRARAAAEALPCPPELKRFLLSSLNMAEFHGHWSREEKSKVYDEYDAAVEAVAELRL